MHLPEAAKPVFPCPFASRGFYPRPRAGPRLFPLRAARERLLEERELIERYRPVVDRLAEAVQDLDESPWLAVLPFLVGLIPFIRC